MHGFEFKSISSPLEKGIRAVTIEVLLISLSKYLVTVNWTHIETA
jgi:hypothetical protein